MWPGFVYQLCQTWIKFAVGCRPFSVFLPLQKPTLPNSNFDLETEDEQLLCGGATAKSHLFIFILFMSFLLKSEYCKDTHMYDTLKKTYRVF